MVQPLNAFNFDDNARFQTVINSLRAPLFSFSDWLYICFVDTFILRYLNL
jgi:hypothetical protein